MEYVYSMMIFLNTASYLYETERRGKRTRKRRDRERVCVRDKAWQREEVALVVKLAVGEM